MSGSAQQTSYSLELTAPSQPGHVTDSHPGRIRAFRNDNVAAIAFGVGVCRSTNVDDRGFDVMAAARQFIGVLTWSQSQEAGFPVGTANDGAAPTEMQAILEDGEVLVSVTEAVTPDDIVRVNLSGGSQGLFCKTANAGVTAKVPNAKFVSRSAGAGVVKMRLNSPGGTSPLLTAD